MKLKSLAFLNKHGIVDHVFHYKDVQRLLLEYNCVGIYIYHYKDVQRLLYMKINPCFYIHESMLDTEC